MEKSNSVAYVVRKIKTTGRSQLMEELQEAPLNETERNFILDIINGLSYSELAAKYNKSESRIGKWKRELCERLARYDKRKLC